MPTPSACAPPTTCRRRCWRRKRPSPAKRWATIAPNYEYGQSAVAVFKQLLQKKRPDVSFVGEQWPPQGKIDAGAVAEAIKATQPEAILNVEFGADLIKLVREGTARGLFEGRSVVSFLTGEPEYLDPSRRTRRSAGSSPAIPGTRTSPRPTSPSSRPTRPGTPTIPGSARWSATPR